MRSRSAASRSEVVAAPQSAPSNATSRSSNSASSITPPENTPTMFTRVRSSPFFSLASQPPFSAFMLCQNPAVSSEGAEFK